MNSAGLTVLDDNATGSSRSVMTNRTAIVVTGASGWIGSALCAALKSRGLRVLGLSRRPSPSDESWSGDLTTLREAPPDLRKMLESAGAVIHCAGLAHRPRERAREIGEFQRVNVDATRALLRVCELIGVPRFVFVSTIAGYDWNAIGEQAAGFDSPLRFGSAYSRSKLEGEQAVRESSLDWRVVRLATVFGPGDHANFARLASGLHRGRFILPGDGSARKSVIPLDLAADLLCRLALTENPKHRLMHGALSEAPTLREITDAFSEVCGFPPARTCSRRLLENTARVGDLVARVVPRFPLTTGMLHRLTTTTVVKTRRLLETFPDFPQPTFKEALAGAAEYYRSV